MHGFYGRVLNIDVTKKQSSIETVPNSVYETYLGGKGLASYLLYELNPQGVDPMAPENCLIFATGPAAGSSIWGSSRYGVFTKSPLTGFYSESYSGGKVPEAIDSAGFDAIVIQGKSAVPTVLAVHPDGVDFHNAGKIWGMDTFETEAMVIESFRRTDAGFKRPGVVVIGPAAENGVRFATIKNDGWRCAGRTGVGTVMGSKKVKAIIFQGDCKRPLYDKKAVREFARNFSSDNRDNPVGKAYKSMGTSQMVKLLNNANAFPTRYWSESHYKDWKMISADALHSKCKVKPHACLKCFMACGRMTEVQNGRHTGLKIEGPEYETIYAFGGLCLINQIEEIIYLNDICDHLGMDTITAGNLCAFSIEAAKRGKIDYAIDYGDVDAIARLLEMIVKKEGVGEVLSQGIKHAAKQWELEDIAIHAKGMEPPGYDPRILKGMGLGYATSDRGACHLRATFYKPELVGMIPKEQIEGKAELFIDFEDRLTLFDTLILCRFYRDLYTWEGLGQVIHTVTGFDPDKASIRKIAGAVADIVRRFNLREGLTTEDDRLSKGFYRKLTNTDQMITEEELLQMIKEYYSLRGWNPQGEVV